jgi:hypothetical protein
MLIFLFDLISFILLDSYTCIPSLILAHEIEDEKTGLYLIYQFH